MYMDYIHMYIYMTRFWNGSKSHISISLYIALPYWLHSVFQNISYYCVEFITEIMKKVYKKYYGNTYGYIKVSLNTLGNTPNYMCDLE